MSTPLLTALLAIAVFGNSSPATKDEPQPQFQLCVSPGDHIYRPWVTSTAVTAGTIHAKLLHGGTIDGASLEVSTQECPAKLQDGLCAAENGLMICRAAWFQTAAYATAWRVGLRNTVPRRIREPTSTAFLNAQGAMLRRPKMAQDASIRAGVLPEEHDLLADFVDLVAQWEANPKLAIETFPEDWFAFQGYYHAAFELVVAFVLGHELYHLHGGQCPLDVPLKVEASGVWGTILALQLNPRALGSSPPDVHELKADRCGLRFIRASLDAEEIPLEARQLASELLADGFMTKWEPEPGPFKLHAEYLYPGSRAVLVSAELRAGEGVAPVCGDTARSVVASTKATFAEQQRQEPELEGDLPDSFVDLLPPGVSVGWEEDTWTGTSFDCRP